MIDSFRYWITSVYGVTGGEQPGKFVIHSFGPRARIPHEWIKAHLGHSQGADVLKASYLQDRMRAVNLMRAQLGFIEQALNKADSGDAGISVLNLVK